MNIRPWIFACCVGLLLLGSRAHADERVLDYHSDIKVNADGSMEVAETVHVRAEHNLIRFGIAQDFVTSYRDAFGITNIGFEMLDAELDGHPERWQAERTSEGLRIYVGNPDVAVAPGEHRYALLYRIANQIDRYSDHDQLEWNVTGTGWQMPIDSATATVTLPGSVDAAQLRVVAYTGKRGERTSVARAQADAPSHAVFATRAPLPPHERLLLNIRIPKGVVAAPGFGQRLHWLFVDNKAFPVGILGALITLLCGLSPWWRNRTSGQGGFTATRNGRLGENQGFTQPVGDGGRFAIVFALAAGTLLLANLIGAPRSWTTGSGELAPMGVQLGGQAFITLFEIALAALSANLGMTAVKEWRAVKFGGDRKSVSFDGGYRKSERKNPFFVRVGAAVKVIGALGSLGVCALLGMTLGYLGVILLLVLYVIVLVFFAISFMRVSASESFG